MSSPTNHILQIQKPTPTIVGISGVDASGKTTFAKKLTQNLKQQTDRQILSTSIDNFHNPRSTRYSKGKDSPEGYYYDSFNLDALKNKLLNPISKGEPQVKLKHFDNTINVEVECEPTKVKSDAILILEGIFLFRDELVNYFDYKIWLDIDFDTMLKRGIARDGIEESYRKRYIPGQKLHLKDVNPIRLANYVVKSKNLTSNSSL